MGDKLLRHQTAGRGLHRRHVLRDTLDWLWKTTVGLGIAELRPPSAAEPVRVWWVPTGLLSLSPLRAAGPASGPGCLEHVVSSYVPTLRTLAHLRGRPVTPEHRQLTVAFSNTSGGVRAARRHRGNRAPERLGGGRKQRQAKILRAVDSDPVMKGWARVAVGRETCSFCMMLASRGPVYTSADMAGLDLNDTSATQVWRQGPGKVLHRPV